MQVISPNNVKIYNLSAGKSLPDVSKTLYFLDFFEPILLINNSIFIFLSGLASAKNVQW